VTLLCLLFAGLVGFLTGGVLGLDTDAVGVNDTRGVRGGIAIRDDRQYRRRQVRTRSDRLGEGRIFVLGLSVNKVPSSLCTHCPLALVPAQRLYRIGKGEAVEQKTAQSAKRLGAGFKAPGQRSAARLFKAHSLQQEGSVAGL
jgi:hypothetical protein